MVRVLVFVVGLLASHALFAQPSQSDYTLLPAAPWPRAGDTRIPVETPRSTEMLDAEDAKASAPGATVSLEQPIDPDAYVCGPGDVFDLHFWGQQNFRLRIAVDFEGRTFISKVGFVPVAGKTLTAVRTAIRQKIRATYPGLQFDLTLASPRSFLVHVAGNVKNPGAYTTTPIERVASLLSRAGGVTTSGSRRRVLVKHGAGTTTTADLLAYELTGDVAQNPYVVDGDVILVPVTEMKATIVGSVHRPGTYELIKGKDLDELVQLAGGMTSAAAHTLPIRIVRLNKRQQQTFRDLPWRPDEKLPAELLQDGDRVLVRSIDELQRSIQLIGAVAAADQVDAATSITRLAFVEGDTVMSLIDRAGGIRAAGDLRRSYISRPQQNGQPQLIPVDLEALLVRRDFSADRPVMLGDTIVVPTMQYSVLVQGAVTRAGLYPFNPVFGIREYIAYAGGRTRTARDLDEVQLIDVNGKTRPYTASIRPSPGDAILVPERNFSRPEVAQIIMAAAGLVLSGVAITLAVTR